MIFNDKIAMTVRIYVRASTKEQDAERALSGLIQFSQNYGSEYVAYIENESGTKLNRPILNQLLNESMPGDILMIESVDRLSRLQQADFEILKQQIKDKGLRLIVSDLPTTHMQIKHDDTITTSLLELINNMLIDLLATMARLDNEKRRERIILCLNNIVLNLPLLKINMLSLIKMDCLTLKS